MFVIVDICSFSDPEYLADSAALQKSLGLTPLLVRL